MLLTYTWAKAIDTVGSRLGVPGDPGSISRNVSLNANRGRGDADIPHRFAGTMGYETPFGPGKPYLTDNVCGQDPGWMEFQRHPDLSRRALDYGRPFRRTASTLGARLQAGRTLCAIQTLRLQNGKLVGGLIPALLPCRQLSPMETPAVLLSKGQAWLIWILLCFVSSGPAKPLGWNFVTSSSTPQIMPTTVSQA